MYHVCVSKCMYVCGRSSHQLHYIDTCNTSTNPQRALPQNCSSSDPCRRSASVALPNAGQIASHCGRCLFPDNYPIRLFGSLLMWKFIEDHLIYLVEWYNCIELIKVINSKNEKMFTTDS